MKVKHNLPTYLTSPDQHERKLGQFYHENLKHIPDHQLQEDGDFLFINKEGPSYVAISIKKNLTENFIGERVTQDVLRQVQLSLNNYVSQFPGLTGKVSLSDSSDLQVDFHYEDTSVKSKKKY